MDFELGGKSRKNEMVIRFLLVFAWVGLASGAEPKKGVLATFRGKVTEDALIVPNLSFYVPRGEAASSFVEPFAEGNDYGIDFSGWLSVELRANYKFSAVLNGRMELRVNGTTILKAASDGKLVEAEKPARLNRGTNAIVVHFGPPPSGDAQLQVLWASKTVPHPIPIPSEVLSCDGREAKEARAGLELFRELRCAKCHRMGKEAYSLDAPDLAGIGSRLKASWMAKFIAAPPREMPRLFAEDEIVAKAKAIAAFLETMKDAQFGEGEGKRERGEELYKELHCAACHDHERQDLSRVGMKFRGGALSAYLQNPQAHFRWSRMPNFRLSVEEADGLAAFLTGDGATEEEVAGDVGLGKDLVQRSGCLSCHNGQLENKRSAPGLRETAKSPNTGCLSDLGTKQAPRFALNETERNALRSFLKGGEFESLERRVPHEFALEWMERLQCGECHDKVEGLPRLGILGGKLKPEWTERFVSGQIANKPRPWLQARMPAFPEYAGQLAEGMAALHGVGKVGVEEKGIDAERAATGAKLVSSAGGFACVACHAVGQFSSGQVVESPGINLAVSAERLLPSFFHRWVMNPVEIDPTTKMPVYFDELGKSQLTEIFEGEGDRQIDAIWEYVRLGEKMPAPPSP